jgi:hypothetical protein
VPRSSLIVPIALGVLLACLYGATLTNHLTGDSIQYAYAVLARTDHLLHPHHLFYHGLMALGVAAFGSHGSDVDRDLRVMEALNALLSVAGVLVFYAICRRLGQGRLRASLFALLFGLSSAYFAYTSQIEVYNITCLCLGLAILGLVPAPGGRQRLLVAVGYFLAMGFHQMAIFFAPAILAAEWAVGRGRDFWRRAALSLGAPLVAIGACYAIAGLALGFRDPRQLYRWLTLYQHLGFWGQGSLSVRTLRDFAAGAGKALLDVTYEPEWMLALMGICLLVYCGMHRDALSRPGPHRRLLVALLLWLVPFAVFLTWWHAENVESWIVACLGSLVMLAALQAGSAVQRRRARDAVANGLLAVCLALMVFECVRIQERNLQPNASRQAALGLRAVVRDGDHVLALNAKETAYYEMYTLGRGVRIESILGLAAEAAERSDPRTFTDVLVDRCAQRAAASRSSGGRCLLDAAVGRGEIDPIRHMRSFDRARFATLLAERFVVTPVPDASRPVAYEITATAAPASSAMRPGPAPAPGAPDAAPAGEGSGPPASHPPAPR